MNLKAELEIAYLHEKVDAMRATLLERLAAIDKAAHRQPGEAQDVTPPRAPAP